MDYIICNDCNCKRKINNKTKTIVGYKNNIGYLIEYYHCRCGNNIVLKSVPLKGL